MGYITRFELETSDDDKCEPVKCPTCGYESFIDHQERIVAILGYSPFDEERSWYEHEEVMKEYSKNFPDVVFTLSGEGEENDDIWKKYFKNGKMQKEKAKVQIAEFDPDKLV